MLTTNKIIAIKEQIKAWKMDGCSIGFVPTMGYLHEGHQSLIRRSVTENDKTVVSIFVNPTQFGPSEDFEAYPRDLEADKALCENTGADLIFCPEAPEMYPEGFCSYVAVENLTKELCGKSRPTHFNGVSTVVNKLLNIITPDRAYFGQKDAQQLAVIRRMVRDLNMAAEIIGCEIIREKDGLAKSSRNTYLDSVQRIAATILSKSLVLAKSMMASGEKQTAVIIKALTDYICREPLAKIDYVEIVDSESMEKVDEVQGEVLVALAVYIGKTRLIDNILYKG